MTGPAQSGSGWIAFTISRVNPLCILKVEPIHRLDGSALVTRAVYDLYVAPRLRAIS